MHRHTVNRFDAISETESRVEGRRVFKGSRDVSIDRIADRIVLDGCADAVILALLLSFHLFEFFGVEVIRMGVKRSQHARN